MGRGSSPGGGGGVFKLIQNAKEFNTTAQADAFFGDNLADLTALEKKALTWYTSGAYDTFNEALRKGAPIHPNRLKSMDDAMAKSVLKEAIVVTRGSTGDLLGFKTSPTLQDLQGIVGGEFMDKAFVSTSAKKGGGFGGSVQYKITVPPGKGRGQYIENISHYKGGNEVEFLLKRNTKFRVTGVSGSNMKPTVHLQVID